MDRHFQTSIVKWIFLALTVGWMILIFWFSARPGQESTEMSMSAGEKVAYLFVPGYRNWTEEEQKELIHAWLVEKGDGEAVIESFLPQILEIARTHTGKGVLFGDLVQEGNIGLLEAMAIYQGKDAEGFLAHAKSAVEDSILDAIAIQRGSDSVGEAMAIKANRLDDASTFLSKELGREPKIEELAKYLSMTEEEVKEVMKISLDALSVMEADIKQS